MLGQGELSVRRSMSLQTKPRVRKILRAAISIPVIGGVLYLLSDYLAEIDAARLGEAIVTISPLSIALSAIFTAASLYAVAGYDRLAARQMGLELPDAKTREGGFAAVAISQAAGFGVLTGSFVRWRMYRSFGVNYAQAVGVTALVIAGFSVGFTALLSGAVLLRADSMTELTGMGAAHLRVLALLGLIAVAAYLVVSLLQPRMTLFGRSMPVPPFRLVRSQIKLAVFDLVPAAAALWVLIPADGGISLLAVVPIYLVALTIGMVSNVPGGLGVLELAILMALPVMPPENLLAALIVYRGVYYAIPALLGVAILAAREFGRAAKASPHVVRQRPDVDCLVSDCNRAESMFARLGDKQFLVSACGRGVLMYAARANSLVALGDPLGPEALWPELTEEFARQAQSQFASPVHYKISHAFSAFLVGRCMISARTGMNGLLNPTTFTTKGSKFARLRRALRAAEKTGLRVESHAPGSAPLHRLAPIAAGWAAAKGGERGFSMGYWATDYVRQQFILEAKVGDETVGFLSLVHGADRSEFALDLVRLAANAPQGTAQALTVAAIELAGAEGAERFSLAGIPLGGIDMPEGGLERVLLWVRKRFGDSGLWQFKSGFRPDWETTYTAAPSHLALACGLRDTYLLVHDGPPSPVVLDPLPELGRAYA